MSGTHLNKIESDVVLGYLQENITSIRKHQHNVALTKIINKLQLAKW